MKRRNPNDDGECGNKKLREEAVCQSSSSQESSSTTYVKDILRRRIEQKRVKQNEERFSRSEHDAILLNWASILSNLGYFYEVRSIMESALLLHLAEFPVPIVALIIEKLRVRFIFTRTFLGTAASRGIFKIFTPQVSQAHVSRKSKRLTHESVTRCVSRCYYSCYTTTVEIRVCSFDCVL